MVKITVKHRPNQFVQVPNDFIRNSDLRRSSKALLIEMMSHGDGYVISEATLVCSGAEGRDAVRSCIKELQAAGYVRRQMVQSGNGRFAGARYFASFYPEDFHPEEDEEIPESEDDSTASENPSTVPPSRIYPVGKTEWENPTLKNTNKEHQERRDSVAALPHPAPGLFEVERIEQTSTELEAAKQPDPWDVIAKRAYDATAGALPFMGMKTIAKWAINQKGATPQQVETAIATLYRSGRAVTKVILGQMLDGIIRQDGTTGTAAERRERNNFDMIRWAQEQDAKNGETKQLEA